ncbi:hypothetical protein DER46DRAFT_671463 [Fusarium sp. MPI-SDFR-AT-0072]|nr:hypothetical protein DER46DRAFT_671463 [Fusarium sp. MPI-SDFR-AT-0072]
MDKSTVKESDISGTESSSTSSQRLQPKPVTRKRPAAEPLLQTPRKQPCHQLMAVSAMTDDGTQCPLTDRSLSSELKQYNDAESVTSAVLKEKGHELDAAQAHLEQLIKKNEKTQAAISVATEKVERLKTQVVELTEYTVFIRYMSRLCEAGPKGLKRVVDALSEQGLEFEMLIGEGVSGGQVSADKCKWKPTRGAGFRAIGHGK